MKREMTCSVYLIDALNVLLIYHQKLQKWLPPGGHLELNETPIECARREVLEEAGLEFKLLTNEKIEIDCWNAKSIPTPYITLLENIPPYKDMEEHQHIDFIFVGKPLGDLQENFKHDCRWFSQSELAALMPDNDIFQETLDVINHLFLDNSLNNHF